jgi:hypothetical protein
MQKSLEGDLVRRPVVEVMEVVDVFFFNWLFAYEFLLEGAEKGFGVVFHFLEEHCGDLVLGVVVC